MLHEGVEVELTGVNALALQDAGEGSHVFRVHVGHTGHSHPRHTHAHGTARCSSLRAGRSGLSRHTSACQHHLELLGLCLLVVDRGSHVLLAQAILGPGELVKAIVEEVSLIGAG